MSAEQTHKTPAEIRCVELEAALAKAEKFISLMEKFDVRIVTNGGGEFTLSEFRAKFDAAQRRLGGTP